MTTFIVTIEHNGETWPLRGTTWAYSMDRAQHFETEEAAKAALLKAKPFMKAAMFKKARIVKEGPALLTDLINPWPMPQK